MRNVTAKERAFGALGAPDGGVGQVGVPILPSDTRPNSAENGSARHMNGAAECYFAQELDKGRL